MKRKISVCIALLVSCSTRNISDEECLQKISILDQNGLIQMISTKNELKNFEKIDFLSSRPDQFVTRVYEPKEGKRKMLLTSYYPTGTIKEYLEAEDGRAFGAYIYWHENGKKKVEGKVVGGVADLSEKSKASLIFDGEALAYDANGKLEAKLCYLKGKLHGDVLYFFPNGSKKLTTAYTNGQKQGWEYSYYENHQLKAKMQYKRGKLDGVCQEFYENGAKKSMELWMGGLLKRGHYFDRSGSLLSMVQDGSGIQTTLEESGRLETTFVDGKVEGKQTQYDSKGVMSKYTHIKEGKKHGEEKTFYVSAFSHEANPKMSIFYVQDVVQGPVSIWYKNGALQAQMEMSDNKKHGLATGYYEDGSVMYIEKYDQGHLTEGKYYKLKINEPFSEVNEGSGKATFFDNFGNIEKQISYEKGKALKH